MTNNPFGLYAASSLTIYAYGRIVLGALLGTQNGREVEIVNTFELALEGDGVDHGFLVSRREQCACSANIMYTSC